MNKCVFNRVIFLSILLFFVVFGYAQQNDSIVKLENTKQNQESKVKLHSPKKAALMSTIIPGLGQVYNKKYWKLPIIYGAYGYATYSLINNHKFYVKYRNAYAQRVDDIEDNETLLPEYKTEDLRIIKNIYWKDRDLNFLILIGLHALNILDAAVDAHLFYFDISDDLTFNIKPSSQQLSFGRSQAAGITFSLNF
jgi:hypothetical protein